MNAAQTTTGNQRWSALCRSDAVVVGSSDELVDRSLDNRQHLFPVLGVEKVLELRTLTDVLAAVTGLLLLAQMSARHQIQKGEDAAAFDLAEIALELLVDRETKREVAEAVTHFFGEFH